MLDNIDYEKVAEQLQACIDGKRQASPALLTHARDAAEALASAHSKHPGLRAGRPEHLTIEAAEAQADWLREQRENCTVVGKLLIVVVDELREQRKNFDEMESLAQSHNGAAERLQAENAELAERLHAIEPHSEATDVD